METNELKIAIIGAGNMGGAIARGLSRGTLVNTNKIFVSDVSGKNLSDLKVFSNGITISKSNKEIIEDAAIIILAVKPWLIETIAKEIANKIEYKKQIIVSIAAGVDFEKLADFFDTDATMFRVIPNTAIEVLQSVSTISSFNATKEQETLIISLFGELGKVFLVPEAQLNAFMSLSSSGIAYAFRYIRAAVEAFLEKRIRFDQIHQVNMETLSKVIPAAPQNLADLLALDQRSRAQAAALVQRCMV